MSQARIALLHAAPALIYLIRLAGLPTAADRLLGALIVVTQVASLTVASLRLARGLAEPGDRVEVGLIAGLVSFAVPAIVVSWLGAAGLARPLPVALACGAVALTLHLRAPDPGRQPAPPATPLDRFALPALAFIALVIGHLTLTSAREAPRDADSVWYHLTTAAEIVRTGSIRPNAIVTDTALGYPAAREALLAWLMMPLRSANLGLLFPPTAALAAAAVYAVARTFAVDRAPALAAAAVFTACPAVATAAIEQKNDLFLAAAFLLAWYFLRRASITGLRRYTALAGLASGLLVSTKFAGLVLFAVLLGVQLAADLAARRPFARALAIAAATLSVAAIAGGVWYAKNLVLFHNPVYPKPVAVLGHPVFAGLAHLGLQYEMTKLGLAPKNTLHFADQFLAGLGPVAALAFAPTIAAPLAARRRFARLHGEAALSLGALPLILFIVYASLPFSIHPRGATYWYVQPRFLLSCLATASIGLAALVPDAPRPRAAGLAALAILAAGGAALGLSPVAFAVILAASAASWWLPGARLASIPRPRLHPAAAALALLAAAALALRVEDYREAVKADPDRGYRADPVEGWGDVCLWTRAHVARARVLYTGTIQMYPLYGPGLTNTLSWVKTDARQDDSENIYRAAVAGGADYIVSFAPVLLRYGAVGELFKYGPSPLHTLAARHPGAIEIVFTSGHAEVARVKERRPTP